MKLGPFLKERRKAQGHGTIGALANFAKALNIQISRESLRLFENENKVPNPSTRKMLGDLLRLSVYERYTLEKLCAESTLNKKFALGPVIILDQETANSLAAQVSSQTRVLMEEKLPLDDAASEEDITEITKEVMKACQQVLTPLTHQNSI